MGESISLKCSIVRGGTSKGIFIMESELPKDAALRDKYILEIFGSPDIRQIDGLGGADVLSSKLAIIGPPTREDADIDYTFGQVSFESRQIDYKSNCGNISAGVGPFAIDNKLVEIEEPCTTVRIHQVNTNTIIKARVQVENGKSKVEGSTYIDGVSGSGSEILLDFSDSVGSITGKLLPTGNVTDKIVTEDGRSYEVSIVDAAIPTVFIEAESLNIQGTETPAEIEQNTELMNRAEEIRGRCAKLIGLTDDYRQSVKNCPYTPFFSIVTKPKAYESYNGKSIDGKDTDIVSRLIFMQKMHKTHPVTGTICMSAAARIPGSIVNRNLSERGKSGKTIIIGHPAGVIPVVSELENKDGEFELKEAAVIRTARIIMDGNVYLRVSKITHEHVGKNK